MNKFRGLWVGLIAVVAALVVGYTVQTIENIPSRTPSGSDVGTYYHYNGSTYQVFQATLSQMAGGYLSNVTTTVAVLNTNQLWATGAGTAAANSEYVLSGVAAQSAAMVNGFVYTNILATAGVPNSFICATFGGQNPAGNFDQKPFYIGITTNNLGSVSTSAPNDYWYFSSIAINAYYNNADDGNGAGEGAGASPLPTVVYGTNFVPVTSSVYFNPAFYTAAYTNGFIYVSHEGNDVLASNLQCAFATCQAAKNFASAGDLIDVAPGAYYDRDLLKNGVDWKFEPNSFIGYDVHQTDMSTRGIFDDYVGAVTSSVTCDQFHFTVVSPGVACGVMLTNAATRLKFTASAMDGDVYQGGATTLMTPNAPSLPQAGGGSTLFTVVNAAYLEANIGSIHDMTNGAFPVLNENYQNVAFGTWTTAPPKDEGIAWSGGEAHFTIKSLIVTNLVGSATYAFVSDNNQSTETSCFLNADFVDGYQYWEDSNPLARTWLNVGFAEGPASGIPALEYHGKAFNYYTGQKIAATGVAPFMADDTSGSSPFKLWASIQKVTQNGAGPWLNVTGPGCQIWWNVLQFEDNSGGTMTAGLNLAAGTNVFVGGQANMLSSVPTVSFSGGKATLTDMTLQALTTNYPVALFTTGSTNYALTLQNDQLLSNAGAACSIWTGPAITGAWVITPGFLGATLPLYTALPPTNLVHLAGTTYYHAQAAQ